MPRSSTPRPEKISSSIRSTSIVPLLSPILSTHSRANSIIDLTRSPEPHSRSVGVASTPKRIRHGSSTSSESAGVAQHTVRAIIHKSPGSITRSDILKDWSDEEMAPGTVSPKVPLIPVRTRHKITPTVYSSDSSNLRSISRSPRAAVGAAIFDILKDWSDDETASGRAASKVSIRPVRTRHKIMPMVYSSDSPNLRSISSEKSRPSSRLFETLVQSPPQNLIESSSKSTSPIPLEHSDRSDEIISEPTKLSSGSVSSVRLYPVTSSPSIFIDLKTPDDNDADVLDDDEEKEQLKLLELEAKRKDSERRKVSFVKPDYLHVDGVDWHSYTHDYISFTFTSSKIYPNHFEPTQHYRFSLIFDGKRWIIKRFQVPNYEEILELYNACNMFDEHVNSFLEFVLQVIRSNIDEQVELKNEKMRLYRVGHKIEINVNDEIMLSVFERSFLKRKRKEIEKRMIPAKQRKFIQ